MRVSLFVLGKVTKHGVLMCINKKVVQFFHREGSYSPPRLDRVKNKAIDVYSASCNIFECYVCQKLNQ